MTSSIDRTAMFLAGVGIGIAGAVLLAPQSGTETRQRIKNGATGAVDQLNGLKDKVAQEAGKKMEEAGKRLQNA